MYYNRKKELIKNGVIIGFILLLAIISTRIIYFTYKNDSNVDYNSESLDIVFHEKNGANISINKVVPVTDSVGLSSKAYTFTIKNNLTEPVQYKINLVDNLDLIASEDCGEYLINKEYIKVSIKEEGKDNKIYTAKELEEHELLSVKTKALEEKDYSVRVWVDKDVALPQGSNLHYHGTIKVVEE